MKDRLIKILQDTTNKSVDFVYKVLDKQSSDQPIAFTTRRDLNEVLEAFYHISSLSILQPKEDALIKRIFKTGEYIIYEKLLHFGSYYYSKQTLIHKGLNEKEEILRRTNVESASMLARVRSFQLGLDGIGGSTDDYFIERMPQLLDGISYIIDKNLTDVFLPSLYNLLNLHQTIYSYFNSSHEKYHPDIDKLLIRVKSLTDKLYKKIEIIEFVKGNLSLELFHEQYLYNNSKLEGIDYSPSINLDKDISTINLQQRLRILINWSVLDPSLFSKHFENMISEVEKLHTFRTVDAALIMRIIAIYIATVIKEQVEITINLKFEKIDITEHLPTFFKGIDKIGGIEVDEDEIALLHSYDDSTLRAKVAACIDKVPANEIEREMRKPHGVFEIADMELKIKINDKQVYLCMPFKTGKEIKSGSVSIDVFYQLLRPFFHFSNCAVVFISAKSCSQNLLNEIKRAQDKYSFSIEVIENRQLAKLLKYNAQLN